MSLVNQLQARYEWTPNYRLVFRKPVPTGLETVRVPQSTGIPGWLVFTYNNDIPVCFWITAHECRKIPCIIDERICGDTFLKVEKIGPLDFLVADIWMYNSNCVFACSTFQQRYDWLATLLETCTSHVRGTAKLIHKSNFKFDTIRGYEEYSNETIGKSGYFIEKDNSEIVKVVQLSIPDCYEVSRGGYLKVPDLKTSFYLRSKGKEFECSCIRNEDDSWSVAENIPDID